VPICPYDTEETGWDDFLYVKVLASKQRRIATIMTLLLLCLLLGCLVGLRSLTAPAVVCWAAHLGWLNFAGTKLAFIDRPVTLVVLTLLAVFELIADKLPKTPARTAPLGLIARIVLGCLCGAALATSAGGKLLLPAIVGVVGALMGTFAGYQARHTLVFRAHVPDFAVAMAEDVIAVAGSLLVVTHV
jgi:uncharacterized membrane protein